MPLAHATTVVGPLVITAHLHVTGDFPELVGRLWDVSPSGQTRQIVEAGVLRPDVNQQSTAGPTTSGSTDVRFELAPNEYTVAAGDTLELELVGSTAPWFRASNGTFTIAVTDLHASIGTH
jgi:predicted acyl esterase